MKLFIDTNIFLDVLFKRKFFKSSLEVLEIVAEKEAKGIVLDITLLNIDYVARKQLKDIREFLILIEKNFYVVGATNKEMHNALMIENSDLEDNLQYICALKYRCDYIITNDNDFVTLNIPTISSVDFIKKIKND